MHRPTMVINFEIPTGWTTPSSSKKSVEGAISELKKWLVVLQSVVPRWRRCAWNKGIIMT